MADSEVLKKLKDIPFRIQTASLKERRNVVEGIQDVLSTPGITEAAVRFVCRTLTMTLHRYRDSTSQSYVKRLLLYLVTNHREWTLRNLIPLLLEISETLRNTTSTKNTAQSGLYALRWTTILAENALKALQEDVDYNSLVLSQANLLAVITANGDRKRHEKGYSMMHNSWSAVGKDNVSKWLDVLLKQAPDAGPHVCVAYSTLCRHYNDLGEDNVISAHKAKMLETFIKSLISVKTRPNSNYIKGCSDFLHLLTKSEVQDTLVPALHKAMLRSPETIIQAVGEVMNNLEVDLDGPIVEIGKSLIVNVHSKDAWVRSEAAAALERVSLRVSSPAAAHALLTYAFDEYNGASGKLTSSEDKIAVLYAVGVLSALCVRADTSGASALFALAAAGLARVLDADTHERTLCAALGALQRWAGRCSRDAPTALLAIYKKGLSLKSTVGAVRTAYTSAMVDAVRGAAGGDLARELWPPLSAAAEKAQQQPLQPAIVSEGLVSLLGLVSLDAARAQQLPCWAALTHTDKHVLLHDRVLTAATDDVLAQVVLLCATVLETCPSVANEKNSPIYRAFILMLLSPIKAVRACAVDEAKKLLANQERGHIARYLMEKLTEVLEENKYLSGKEKTPTEDKDKSSEVTGKMILDCVHALCSFRVYPRVVVQSLLVCALPACHAPLVACSARGAWRALCTQLRVVPAEVIADNDHGLNETYVNGFSPTPTMSNIVCTLISACPERVSARAVQRALDILQDEALLRVTRDEYFTYLTPDTELYDKSVVPGNEDNSAMNLKRESKAYSYKEQLEELQLRRELAEKRKLEGKVKEVPLSAKQKEAMKAQLAKEAAIRQRLTELNSGVQCALGLVDCVSRSCPSSARRVVGALLWSLRSPLCAAAAAQSYLRLRTALAPQLPPSLPVTVLRLHKPACDLDPSWEQEPLAQATAREIQRLHAATVAPRLPAGERSKHHTLDAPAFYYVFPLLQQGVSGAGGKLDEATVLAALAVISEHAAALAQGPLPVQHMFQLLIDLISTSSGRIQTAATAALLEVGRSAMCAGAAPADLHCLLTALQAPAEVVRDASLRALSCVSGRLGGLIEAGDDTFNLTLTRRLYVATFDVSEDNKELAQALWESVPQLAQWWEQISEEDALAALLEEVQQPGEPLQLAAAAAAAARVAAGGGGAADNMLQQLQDAYKQKLPLIPAKLDQFGHVVSEAIDEWESRRGVAHALHALGGALRAAAVPGAMAFFVELALADRAEPVRARMLAAAMAIVDLHGKWRNKNHASCAHQLSLSRAASNMSAMLFITSAIAAVGVAVYFFLTWNNNYWKKRGVVGPKPIFFFGTVKDLTFRKTTLHENVVEHYNDFPNEKYVGLFRYRNPVLLIRDLDIVKHIMIKDFNYFAERGVEYSEKGLGMNIFHASADHWRILRSKFTPIFTSGKLKGMFHLLNEQGDKFIEYFSELVKQNQEVNIYQHVQLYTKTGISSCAFGLDLDVNDKKIFDKLQDIDNLILNNSFINDVDWMFPGILRKLNLDLFPAQVSEFFGSLVRDIFRQRNEVPSNRNDFMDLMLEISKTGAMQGAKRGDNDYNSLQIDERVIAAQVFIFYVAGFETSAGSMSFMLHELAYHPEVQERLIAEIDRVLEQHGKLTYEAIQEMTYLTQVFDETIRKYSIVDPLLRVATADYKVPESDLVIEKGTTVWVSARAIHYDEKIYPDPIKFDPERFSPDSVKNRHAAAYLPFGIGPRNCIGLRFGQLSSRVCMVKVLSRFRVEPASTSTYNLEFNPNILLLTTTKGIPLKLVPRDNDRRV